jgi:hypothetical protein
LPDGLSEIFLRAGLDRANQLEAPRQIGVLAHANSVASTPASEAPRRENDHLTWKTGKSGQAWSDPEVALDA